MPSYKDFQKAQFGPIRFPYTQINIKGSLRHHVHEFPHSAGGKVEKMGRKLYSIRFRIPLHDIPGSDLERDFPQLFPNRLANLLALFDREATLDLVIPNLGTMKCVATEWDGTADMAEALSGDTWNVEFLEDDERGSIVGDIPSYGLAALAAAGDDLAAKALAAYGAKKPPGLFQAINDAITVVDGALGTADAYGRLVAAKIEAVADLCGKADREIEALQDPMNHALVEALKNVWANAVDLAENVPGVTTDVSTFRVPSLMSIGQVSTRLFGSADRGVELLQMNAIDDAFAIKPGTELRYLKKAA